jgi:hypothetical protein
MTPGGFDPVTCRELIGDQRARIVEASARAHADAADIENPGASYRPPTALADSSYWTGVISEAERILYFSTFQRRLERMRRKASTATDFVAAA